MLKVRKLVPRAIFSGVVVGARSWSLSYLVLRSRLNRAPVKRQINMVNQFEVTVCNRMSCVGMVF